MDRIDELAEEIALDIENGHPERVEPVLASLKPLMAAAVAARALEFAHTPDERMGFVASLVFFAMHEK